MADDDRVFVAYWKLGLKWEARVKVDGDTVHVGYFSTEEEAIRKCYEVCSASFHRAQSLAFKLLFRLCNYDCLTQTLRRVDLEKLVEKPWAYQGIHDRTGRPGFRVGQQTRAPSHETGLILRTPSTFAYSGRDPLRQLQSSSKASNPPPAAKHLELLPTSVNALNASRQARMEASKCNVQRALRKPRNRDEEILASNSKDRSVEYFGKYFLKGPPV